MNSTELQKILEYDEHTNLLNPVVKPLNHFLEEPLNSPSITIVNLDSCDKPGSHWVAVYVPMNGKTEYFDSYGNKPNEQFLFKLQQLKKEIVYSLFSVQGLSTVCGQYCLLFLLMRSRGFLFHDIISTFLLSEFSTERDLVANFMINHFYENVLNRKLELFDESFIHNVLMKKTINVK